MFGIKLKNIQSFGNKLRHKGHSFGNKISQGLTDAGGWISKTSQKATNALEKTKNIVDKIDKAVEHTPLQMLTGASQRGLDILQQGIKTAGSVGQGLTSIGQGTTQLLKGNIDNAIKDYKQGYGSGMEALSDATGLIV